MDRFALPAPPFLPHQIDEKNGEKVSSMENRLKNWPKSRWKPARCRFRAARQSPSVRLPGGSATPREPSRCPNREPYFGRGCLRSRTASRRGRRRGEFLRPYIPRSSQLLPLQKPNSRRFPASIIPPAAPAPDRSNNADRAFSPESGSDRIPGRGLMPIPGGRGCEGEEETPIMVR